MTISRIGKRANQKGMVFKKSFQDQRRDNLAALQAMVHPDMSEAGRRHLAEFSASVKPKVRRVKSPPKEGKPESVVQSEIIDYLVRHPQVALVERINAGSVYNANGAYIQFHHIYMPHQFKKSKIERVEMKVSDLHVVMTDGRKGVVECKAESWSGICNDREREQDNYIQHIIANGGFGGFVNSVVSTKEIFRFYGYKT